MNKIEADILLSLFSEQYTNQRILSEQSGYSLGTINKTLHTLLEEGYIDEYRKPSEKAEKLLKECSPENAIILAAGFGMRMVPINTSAPKALLKIHDEIMIERTIKQLQEAGIHKIYIVVGFMKESFEYLIDQFGVELIVNDRYADTNNLYSLYLARNYIHNSYIIPCDIYCTEEVYSACEISSWYMMDKYETPNNDYCVNRKREIIPTKDGSYGSREIGIAYLTGNEAEIVRKRLEEMASQKKLLNCFWEITLRDKQQWMIYARLVDGSHYIEVNTYEQLRALDDDSDSLHSDAIQTIEEVLGVSSSEINNIEIVKKGMMNRSFLFDCRGEKYIMRIPDAETNKLVNRKAEAEIYGQLKGKDICDNCIYINPDNGYKIATYIHDARGMDPYNEDDIKKCMSVVRKLHDAKLKCSYRIDFYEDIEHYESLWNGKPSIYGDYELTKKHVLELKSFINANKSEDVLCHIDVNPDNFLIYKDVDRVERIRLIDWEYAAMQDPDIDVADFMIYVLYDREHAERFIDLYFDGKCEPMRRIKIYAYMSVCGLAWSNWCECKRNLGVELGEYALRQYRYAKDYYKIVVEELAKLGQKL